MKIHDVTLTIQAGMIVWPGDIPVELYRKEKIEEGGIANNSNISMGVHTGTHIDSPYHFINDGIKVDQIPLDTLVGPAQVVELPDSVEVIDAGIIKSISFTPGVRRVLFKTRNSKIWSSSPDYFHEDFVGISADGAKVLVDLGVRLAGIDYLSAAPFTESKPSHDILLGAGMVLIEGLDISKVTPGLYTLVCLPLKLKDTDGSPARVILIEE